VATHDGAAVELSGLTERYRRGKGWFTAVNEVTLAVPPGQVLGLLGPNGAGKTTTIKMTCGLILPSAGTIRVNGYDVARQRPAAVRQIGAVLEGSRNVYWPLSAWQNLLYFGRLKGLRGAEIRPGPSGCSPSWGCGSGGTRRSAPTPAACSRMSPSRPR
jgi:ABC-2 type transport system ATP-binding protein